MKKYQIIYADPPWHYRYRLGNGIAENHYPTMSIDELKALPVKELADKDCALFLWFSIEILESQWQLYYNTPLCHSHEKCREMRLNLRRIFIGPALDVFVWRWASFVLP